MAQWLNYRVRVTISDTRVLVGTFMAFDKYMNLVLADCEEFRKIKTKGRKDDEKETKRTLGFLVLRGETVIAIIPEAPPPSAPKKDQKTPGIGRGQVAGRGLPLAPAAAGLSGPTRGVGGPAPAQMMPPAKAALIPPGPHQRSLVMPPGMPAAMPPGMPGMPPPGMPMMPPVMMGRGIPPMMRPPGQ